jgi:hypothetical protein
MLDYLITKDEDSDTDYHKAVRTMTERPIQTVDRENNPKK